jgi:hypothetical protein
VDLLHRRPAILSRLTRWLGGIDAAGEAANVVAQGFVDTAKGLQRIATRMRAYSVIV